MSDIEKQDHDDDLELEIVDDTPEEDRGRKPPEGDGTSVPETDSDDELASYSESVQKRIKKLKWETHEQRRAKEAAQREHAEAVRIAKQLVEQNRMLEEQRARGEEALVAQAKARVDAELDKARKFHREAYESGDPDKLLEAQELITRKTLEKQQYDNWVPRPAQQVQPVHQPAPEPVQNKPNVDPKAIRWGARNPWFGDRSDPDHIEMTSTAYGIHERLINSGVQVDTDEYYAQIDAGMRRRFPEYFGSDDRQSASAKPANVVAPAGRTAKAPRKVTLTATQVSLAKKLGITPEQYAAQLIKEMGT